MSFKNKKFIVIKKAISKELSDFVCNYFLLKREVYKTLLTYRYIPESVPLFGSWGDGQIPGTYSHYADIAMETLLLKVKPIMEKKTKLKLVPTYSYARIYKKGDILHKHKDRMSCEISTTLNLGGDKWPIYVNPKQNEGLITNEGYIASKSKGIKIQLNPGDMLVYRGCDLEHWRNSFKGNDCVQVFLHYNDLNSKFSDSNKFDGRKMLGVPSDLKKD
jgi:hypothetical protein